MILQRLEAEGTKARKRSKNVFGAALPGRGERRAHYETGKVTWVLFLTFAIFFFPEWSHLCLQFHSWQGKLAGSLMEKKTSPLHLPSCSRNAKIYSNFCSLKYTRTKERLNSMERKWEKFFPTRKVPTRSRQAWEGERERKKRKRKVFPAHLSQGMSSVAITKGGTSFTVRTF